MPFVTLVIPVRRDAEALRRLLGQLSPDPSVEVVIAQADDDDSPVADHGRPDVRLIRGPAGRGRQMNAGAAEASGDWLLFLHADSTVPPQWRQILEQHMPGHVGGWFRFGLDSPSWQARLIERGVQWRTRLFQLPYGDQGLIVCRPVFQTLGGFKEFPLMEDVEFVRRLVAAGPTAELPAVLLTSARRWQRDGWFRRSARNLMLVVLYQLGVSPARLARWYETSPHSTRTGKVSGRRR